jgi:hypothetical protein
MNGDEYLSKKKHFLPTNVMESLGGSLTCGNTSGDESEQRLLLRCFCHLLLGI